MAAWTNATASTAGVLRPGELAQHVHLERHPVGAALRPWVENRWSLAWDLPDGRHYASQTLPHPACHLTVERGATRPELGEEHVVVTGVPTRRFDATVRGRGTVDGLRFRPGGLAALTGRPAHAWTDRTVPAREVLPGALVDAFADLEAGCWRPELEDDLAALGRPDARYTELLTVVAGMLADRTLVSVAQVEERHGLGGRTLQRRFRHYVGVGPKWVLSRYRMHDVVGELDGGYDGSLADLAHRYGWYDQAHFVRDFTALVGLPPGRYRG